MSYKKWWTGISVLALIALLITACGGPATTEAPAATEAPSPTEAPAAEMPSELNVAAILCCGLENDWDATFVESFGRVQAAQPHDLQIADLVFTEGVFGEDAERVMREYAESGQYQVIWAHSTYTDQVRNLKDAYPDILWVVVGGGNEGLGGNVYWVGKQVYEPAYLLGLIAGKMTTSNVIGSVGPFATDDTNAEINAFFDGARSVNSDISVKASFIDSWFDPPKATEASNAQIAAGVDQMFMRADAFDSCEQSQILCYGPIADNTRVAPNTNVADALAMWEPEINYIVDVWYDHAANGTAYAGAPDFWWATMAQGGSALSPINPNLVDSIPQDVLDLVEQTQADILSGALVVERHPEPPVSD